jgi:hypothetical protein
MTQMSDDRPVDPEPMLRWICNIIAVTLLPARLGSSGQTLGMFLIYAVLAGAALTLGENRRYLWTVSRRPDLRSYLRVRVGVVVIIGLIPFVGGATFAGSG